MKKLITTCLILFLLVGAIFAQQQRFRNGTQTGTGVSYNEATGENNGSLTVEVTFRSNRITGITVTQHTDSQAFLTMVSRTMVPAMISAQSTDVNAVSGATYTSNGLKEAVAEAMSKARR
jgi:uncharacterized protein with FMN-binding domain